MAETLDFEAKVQGLIDYYRALEAIDPNNPQHSEVANPGIFYGPGGQSASSFLAEARESVIFDIQCHGLQEYGKRSFARQDLRKEPDELRIDRADILAVMTAPLTPEVRETRRDHIAGVLAHIAAGETVRVQDHNEFRQRYSNARVINIDSSRAMFGVFRNGHISNRILTVQYDAPVNFRRDGELTVGEPFIEIDIPALFADNGLRIEKSTAA